MKKVFWHGGLYDENYEPISLLVPCKKIVCPNCNGTGASFGSDCNESSLVQGLEEDCDFEGLENYYKGAYDKICNDCNGKNVVDEFDWKFIEKNHPKEYAQILEYERSVDADRKYELAEKRALCF
jgi:hypothetical protein